MNHKVVFFLLFFLYKIEKQTQREQKIARERERDRK